MSMSPTIFMWQTMCTCGDVALLPVHAEPCSASFPRQLKSSFPEATSTHINLYIDNHKYRCPSRYITHSYPSPPRDAPLLPSLPSLPPARPIRSEERRVGKECT